MTETFNSSGTHTKTYNYVEAISKLEKLNIIQRIDFQGKPQKFLRMNTDNEIETADNIQSLIDNKWVLAKTDINSFMSSRYRVVTIIEASSFKYKINNSKEYSPIEALSLMVSGNIFIYDGSFYKMVKNKLYCHHFIDREKCNENWKLYTIGLNNFFEFQFKKVKVSQKTARVEFE